MNCIKSVSTKQPVFKLTAVASHDRNKFLAGEKMPDHGAIEMRNEFSPEIVYTLDPNGNFTFLNPAGERLWGYSCEEIRRMNIAEVLTPEFAGCFREGLTKGASEPFGLVYEIQIVTKDQRRLTLETSAHVEVRDERVVEIQGIAVLIATGCGRGIRCLDPNFEFGSLSEKRA